MSGNSRWLIDGLNVIGSRPDGWWRDRHAAMRRLVERVAVYRATTGEAATIVFDGRPAAAGDVAAPGVEVVFTASGAAGAADDEIVRRLALERHPSSVRVVTSDADLAARARSAGARVVSSGSFLRRLERPREEQP